MKKEMEEMEEKEEKEDQEEKEEKEIIASDNRFNEWATFFNKHTKKDDLSDCFLQGMWFIKYKIK